MLIKLKHLHKQFSQHLPAPMDALTRYVFEELLEHIEGKKKKEEGI